MYTDYEIYKAIKNVMTAGMRAKRNAPVNLLFAPLQPSWPHVSQNSVLMYDGVDVLIQLSGGALMSSQEHDRETTTLSLTVKNIETC